MYEGRTEAARKAEMLTLRVNRLRANGMHALADRFAEEAAEWACIAAQEEEETYGCCGQPVSGEYGDGCYYCPRCG